MTVAIPYLFSICAQLIQALQAAGPGKPAACLICRTVVHADDPAFGHPTKYVGPVTTRHGEAAHRDHGWDMRQDGPAWRGVVPSPEPAELVELDMIELLMDHGANGGLCLRWRHPAVTEDAGRLRGVEGVVDRPDRALLAQAVGADACCCWTDVEAVVDGYGTRRPGPSTGPLPESSAPVVPGRVMGPKVEAACRFVEKTSGMAAIGRLEGRRCLLNERRHGRRPIRTRENDEAISSERTPPYCGRVDGSRPRRRDCAGAARQAEYTAATVEGVIGGSTRRSTAGRRRSLTTPDYGQIAEQVLTGPWTRSSAPIARRGLLPA